MSGKNHGEKLLLLQEHREWFSLVLQPALQLCIVDCPQYAVAVLSSVCFHCFLLLLLSLPLPHVPGRGCPFFSFSRLGLKVVNSLKKLKGPVVAMACPSLLCPPELDDSKDSMLVIKLPVCVTVSIPVLETRKRNLGLSIMRNLGLSITRGA